MYAFGIPAGMMVDAKSPRWGLTLGIALLGFGYYPIAKGTCDLYIGRSLG